MKLYSLFSFQTDFDTQLKDAGNKLIVVDFYATWCGPCKMISPKLEEMAQQFSDVIFLKVDVDENEEVASEYGISCMPTFIFIKNGEKVILLSSFFRNFSSIIL